MLFTFLVEQSASACENVGKCLALDGKILNWMNGRNWEALNCVRDGNGTDLVFEDLDPSHTGRPDLQN